MNKTNKIISPETDIQEIMSEDRIPDPGADYWEGFEKRLEKRIHASDSKAYRFFLSAAASVVLIISAILLTTEMGFLKNEPELQEKRIVRMASNFSFDELSGAQELVFDIYDYGFEDTDEYAFSENAVSFEAVEEFIEDDIFDEIFNAETDDLTDFSRFITDELTNTQGV